MSPEIWMPARIDRTMTPSEWGLLFTTSILWGGSFFFTGVAVKELPPFTIIVLRVGIASVLLHVVMRATGQRIPRRAKVWGSFLGMGLLNNVLPFSMIVWSQTRIASGLASILTATTPLFAVIAAYVLTTDEKLTGNRVAGVLIGFLGVVVMMGPAALARLGGPDIAAQFAVLGAAFSYSLASIYGRRFRALGVTPIATATGQVTASTIVMLPAELLIDRPWTLAVPSVSTWVAIVGIAALSTALAYLLYFRILATAGATNLTLVTLLAPISAVLLGCFALGERPRAEHFAGMVLIGLGLAALDGRLVALIRRRSAVASTNHGD